MIRVRACTVRYRCPSNCRRFPTLPTWHPDLREAILQQQAQDQLHVVAFNEGGRRKKALWRPAGRAELESLVLARWASQRRQDLLELLDQLTPKIQELTRALVDRAFSRELSEDSMSTQPGSTMPVIPTHIDTQLSLREVPVGSPDAARLLRIHPKTVLCKAREGSLPAHPIGTDRKRWHFYLSELRFCRPPPPATRGTHANPRRFQVLTGGFTTDVGGLLDLPQRPRIPKHSHKTPLVVLLASKDVDTASEYHLLSESSRLGRMPWPMPFSYHPT
jgi:hypothetical protein